MDNLSALFLQNPQLAIALRRRAGAEGMIKEGTSSDPIRSPWQGVNRLANALLGGYEYRKADEDMKATAEADAAAVSDYARRAEGLVAAQLMGRQGQAPAAPPSAANTPVAAPVEGSAPSASNQDFVTRMLPMAMEASRATGVDPRLILAQSALETGWGKSAPGNNFFGIKGPGQTLATQESVNGQMVPQQASFRAYGSPQESFQDYAAFLRQNPRYASVLGAQGLDAQIDAMGRSGYATDPQYAQKLRMIARGINIPTQEANAGNVAADAAPAPVPRETPGAVSGIPTRPQAGEMSGLQRLYMSGMASNNPRVRAMAQGLAPFMKMERPAPIFQERSIGNDMVQRVVSYDGGASYQPFDAPSRKFAPRQPIQMGNQMYNPDDPSRPIGPAPTPSTAEGMAMQGVTISGQGAPSVSQAVTELKTAGELGGVYAKRAEETMTAGDRARGQMVAIQQLDALGKSIQTGALAPARQQIANLANSLGVDLAPFGIDKNEAGLAQAYNAIVNKLVQSSIGAAQGFSTAQFSNKDLEFVTGQQARLANDPVGNTIILQSGRAIAERTAAKAEALTDYLAGGGKNIAQFERDWNAKMKGVPLFQQVTPEQFQAAPPGVYAVMKPDGKDWDVQVKGVQQQQAPAPQRDGQRPIISNPADAAKLPPGSEFQTPDGRILRVPMR